MINSLRTREMPITECGNTTEPCELEAEKGQPTDTNGLVPSGDLERVLHFDRAGAVLVPVDTIFNHPQRVPVCSSFNHAEEEAPTVLPRVMMRILARVASDGKPMAFELNHKNRRLHYYLTPLAGKDGKIGQVLMHIRDRTKKRRMDERAHTRDRMQAEIAGLVDFTLKCESLDALTSKILNIMARFLDAYCCEVFALSEDRKRLILHNSLGLPKNSLSIHVPRFADDNALEKLVVKQRRLIGTTLLNGIAVAIPSSKGTLGVIGAHVAEPRDFGDDERDLLHDLAAILGAFCMDRPVDLVEGAR